MNPRALLAPKRLLLVAAALPVLLILALAWILGTTSGARFALARAEGLTSGALVVHGVEGRILGRLTLSGVRYAAPEGPRIDIDRVQTALAAWPLFAGRVHLRALDAAGVRIALAETSGAADEPGSFSLKPPVDVVLDRARISALEVRRNEAAVFTAHRIDVAGSWTRQGLTLGTLEIASPNGEARLQGTVAATPDHPGRADADFAWKLGDATWAGTIAARSDGARATLEVALRRPARAKLDVDALLKGARTWSARLAVPTFDPAVIPGLDGMPAASLALDARGAGHAGTLRGKLALGAYSVNVQPLAARLSAGLDRLDVDELALTSDEIKGRAELRGHVELGADPPKATLTLGWQDVVLPAALVGQTLASQGQLDVEGSPAAYRAQGDFTLGPRGKADRIAFQLAGTPRELTLDRLRLDQGQGRTLDARGKLTFAPAPAWDMTAKAQRLDPGRLFAQWPGTLDFALASTGSLASGKIAGTLDLERFAGTLRGHRLRGQGALRLSPAAVLGGHLELHSGPGRIQVDARDGRSNHVEVTLADASPADFLPGAGGTLDGHFVVAGNWPRLSVNGQARGSGLHADDARIDKLHLIVGVPNLTRPAGKIDLALKGVHAGGFAFQDARVLAEGSQGDHRLDVAVRGSQVSGQLGLHGALDAAGRWNGTLSTLDVAPQGLPPWRLAAPVDLAYARRRLTLADMCLQSGAPRLCAGGEAGVDGAVDAHWNIAALPLATILDAVGFTDSPLAVEGSLEGQGTFRRTRAGAMDGEAEIRSAAGSVADADDPELPLMHYADLVARGSLTPERQQLEVHAGLGVSGRLDGQIQVDGIRQDLSGTLSLHLGDLAFVGLLDRDLANVSGTLDARLGLHGTLAQPGISGHAGVSGFAAEVPALGLKLARGEFGAEATGTGGSLHLTGGIDSGAGRLAVEGDAAVGADGGVQLAIRGQKITVVDIPAARVVASPDLSLRLGPPGIELDGKLAIDKADIDVDKLPGAGADQASADVVVVDAETPEAAARRLPFRAQVAVDFGTQTHLTAMGLDGKVSGQLTVREAPGRPTSGQGQLIVEGTYRAYGQDLHIRRGVLSFAGTPLANPGLDLRALRALNPNATITDDQEVGLLITGTAERPTLTVFSRPAMEQSDALSYLVTGKPLSAVSSGEGDVVASAAHALGSAAGNLLAKRVGAELGLDNIGVGTSDALGGSSAFTVGKFLSPRLYLSYGIGLFEPGEVITLRYRLSKRWNLEAQQATEFSRGSLNYRIER